MTKNNHAEAILKIGNLFRECGFPYVYIPKPKKDINIYYIFDCKFSKIKLGSLLLNDSMGRLLDSKTLVLLHEERNIIASRIKYIDDDVYKIEASLSRFFKEESFSESDHRYLSVRDCVVGVGKTIEEAKKEMFDKILL